MVGIHEEETNKEEKRDQNLIYAQRGTEKQFKSLEKRNTHILTTVQSTHHTAIVAHH